MAIEKKFSKLFEPVSIGGMEIRNRIVKSAMHTQLGSEDGYVTDRLLDYYEEIAAGGAGMIIVEYNAIDALIGRAGEHQLLIDDDKFLPGLAKLARVIQKHGAKAVMQLHHAGRVALASLLTKGAQPGAPSAIPAGGPGYLMPRELTVAEIKELVIRFAQCADRAKRAGYDAVEVHAATGYLLNQFLSAASNKRQDAYGGSLENRARFLLEIIAAVRQAVGPSFPLWTRLNGMEHFIPGGIRIEDTVELAKMLEKASVDAIHITDFGPLPRYPPLCEPAGSMVPLGEAVKKVVHVPVISGGRMTAEAGEKVLQEGRVDLVFMGRALWADPEIPNKLATGRADDIIPCIDCRKCREALHDTGVLTCTLNAALGREREYKITPAPKAKRVLVVGGGPAGLETARVAALRKHEVILYDNGERLGGQLTLAAVPPYKEGLEAVTAYLSHQVRKLGVRLETGKEITADIIREIKPDAVVLATGIVPLIPDIVGIDGENVVTAQDILAGKAAFGKRSIVIGGALVGCETAEFLSDRGSQVTIIEVLPEIGANISPMTSSPLLKRLAEKGIVMLAGVQKEEITARGVLIINKEGEKQLIEADTIVLAVGARPNTALLNEVQGMVAEVHLAGDCQKPRDIMGAVADGARIGRVL